MYIYMFNDYNNKLKTTTTTGAKPMFQQVQQGTDHPHSAYVGAIC